jgi:hypothetical protein
MNVEYSINVDDLVAFNEHRARLTGASAKTGTPLILAILVAALLFGALREYSNTVALIVAIALSVTFFLGFHALLRHQLRSSLPRMFERWDDPIEIGSRELSLTPKGFTETQAGRTLSISWDRVRMIRRSGGRLFLHLGPLSVFMIPLDRLGDSSNDLVEFVERHTGHETQST